MNPRILYIICNLAGVAVTLSILKENGIITPKQAEESYSESLISMFTELFDKNPNSFFEEIHEYQIETNDKIFVSDLKLWLSKHNELITDPEGQLSYDVISLS